MFFVIELYSYTFKENKNDKWQKDNINTVKKISENSMYECTNVNDAWQFNTDLTSRAAGHAGCWSSSRNHCTPARTAPTTEQRGVSKSRSLSF